METKNPKSTDKLPFQFSDWVGRTEENEIRRLLRYSPKYYFAGGKPGVIPVKIFHEIIRNLMLNHYFIQIILMIILTGILLSEFFKRSGNQRKGVLVYSFFSALFGLAVLHDMYRYFLTSYNAISLVIYFSLYVLLVGLFMWNSIRYWKLINKTLFFLAFLFGTLAMAFFFLRFYFWGCLCDLQCDLKIVYLYNNF